MKAGGGTSSARIQVSMLAIGLGLVTAFFALDLTSNTIEVVFVPPWDRSAPGELYFWLAAMMFLLPGSALIGASFAAPLRVVLERLARRVATFDARERRALVLMLTALAWSLARLGNQLVMCGQPFTDDEDATRFGGQVIASGALWAPLPPMRFAFPELFLFQRDGHWTSFDFLGALIPWSLSEWTGSGTLIFSGFAGLAPLGAALAGMRAGGAAGGLIAGGAVLFSPMAATLSMTTHAHVVSRGLIALGFGLVLFVECASFSRSFGAGLAFGFAFATRPAETTMLLLPLALGWALDAARNRSARARALGIVLGALPGIVALFAYQYALTDALGFVRGAANEISVPYGSAMRPPLALGRMWPRFGNNLAYNLLTLSIWFFGPIGLFLAWLGARVSREHARLALGALLDLCLALLHDDRGLHMVGPIHLSEAAVPLAILLTPALSRAVEGLQKLGLERARSSTALFGYAVGLSVFSLWHCRALHVQSLARWTITELVEDVSSLPAIVLVPPYPELWKLNPAFARIGSFVFEWRRARPDLGEPVLIVHDSPQARAEVERAFPRRTAYVLEPQKYGFAPVPLASVAEPEETAAP